MVKLHWGGRRSWCRMWICGVSRHTKASVLVQQGLTTYRSVPLDYFNPSAGVAKIALGRFNATAATRKGSVFLNPGGPGGPGVSLATVSGPDLQQLVCAAAPVRFAVASTRLHRSAKSMTSSASTLEESVKQSASALLSRGSCG